MSDEKPLGPVDRLNAEQQRRVSEEIRDHIAGRLNKPLSKEAEAILFPKDNKFDGV
jgi:hypothetical protein